MKLSYQVSRHLANKFCFGHNLGISATMSNDFVLIKVCCDFFKGEIEKDLIKQYGREFVVTKIKFKSMAILSGIDPAETAGDLQHTLGDGQVSTRTDVNETSQL